MLDDPGCVERLRGLRALHLDCGNRDEYRLHYGLRSLARRLVELDVPHVSEEFDGGHSGIDHRLDVSLPRLYEAVSGP
jgi:hypothetical protein